MNSDSSPGFEAPGLEAPGLEASTSLDVRGVSVRFGGLTALDDVSLTAAGRQVTGIIGPNGAGKTTLLNVLCGFVRPQSGRDQLRRAAAGAAAAAPAGRARHRADAPGHRPVRRADGAGERDDRGGQPAAGRVLVRDVRAAPVGPRRAAAARAGAAGAGPAGHRGPGRRPAVGAGPRAAQAGGDGPGAGVGAAAAAARRAGQRAERGRAAGLGRADHASWPRMPAWWSSSTGWTW